MMVSLILAIFGCPRAQDPAPPWAASFGAAVLAIPDCNGDGVGDFIVGDPLLFVSARGARGEGGIWTISGTDGKALDCTLQASAGANGWGRRLWLLPSPTEEAAHQIAVAGNWNGRPGVSILEGATLRERFVLTGIVAVAPCGDWNGDGVQDLACVSDDRDCPRIEIVDLDSFCVLRGLGWREHFACLSGADRHLLIGTRSGPGLLRLEQWEPAGLTTAEISSLEPLPQWRACEYAGGWLVWPEGSDALPRRGAEWCLHLTRRLEVRNLFEFPRNPLGSLEIAVSDERIAVGCDFPTDWARSPGARLRWGCVYILSPSAAQPLARVFSADSDEILGFGRAVAWDELGSDSLCIASGQLSQPDDPGRIHVLSLGWGPLFARSRPSVNECAMRHAR